MTTNIPLAPLPRTIDGRYAVPIDIQLVQAQWIFDGNSQTAIADVIMTYTVGPEDGNPVFCLRQSVWQAWLDWVDFPPARLGFHDFDGDSLMELRIIDAWQMAGSAHRLRMQYPLVMPDAQIDDRDRPMLKWLDSSMLRFSFGRPGSEPGYDPEGWLPANLFFDQFGLTLELNLMNTCTDHIVLTNGVPLRLGPNHWSITFPTRFTALTPMLELCPSDGNETPSTTRIVPVSEIIAAIEGRPHEVSPISTMLSPGTV